jgi:hypothetical protein
MIASTLPAPIAVSPQSPELELRADAVVGPVEMLLWSWDR